MLANVKQYRQGVPDTGRPPNGGASASPHRRLTPVIAGSELQEGAFRVATTLLQYHTDHGTQFIDITEDVERAVVSSGVSDGIAVVFSRHTTAAIKINESEPELLKDMEQFLGEILPEDRAYRHNNFLIRVVNMQEDECPNGHAHCQHLLLSTSENIPLVDGRLQLGRWQRIFLVELDHARPREVVVRSMGC